MSQPQSIQYKRATSPHGVSGDAPESLKPGSVTETMRMVNAAVKRLGLNQPFKGRRILHPKPTATPNTP